MPGPVENEIQRWLDTLLTGDPLQVAALYAPSAILLSTLRDDIRDTPAKIIDYFENVFLPLQPVGTVRDPRVREFGAIAINSGIYEFVLNDDLNPGNRVTKKARYTFVYETDGTDWLIVEHHSSKMPEAQTIAELHWWKGDLRG